MSNKINQYADNNNFDRNNNFAIACCNDNTIEELSSIVISVKNGANINDIADQTDCAVWGITPAQWFDGIQAAIATIESQLLP
jgi:hypothetical protein